MPRSRAQATGGFRRRPSVTDPPASQPSPDGAPARNRRTDRRHTTTMGDEFMTCLKRRPIAAAILALLSTPPLAFAQAQPEQALPEVRVQGEAERADGPVQGYRATRSSTATKTDTPLREVPASVTV